MKYLLIFLSILFSSAQAQDRTVYFPEVRENYVIYHPMIIKDTSKTIWVDSLTMRRLKGEYKVVDSVKFKRYITPRKVIDTTIFNRNPQWEKGPDSAMLFNYIVWPRFEGLWYNNNGAWAVNWMLPCGKTIGLSGKKNVKARYNFSRHCARCKEVFPDKIYFAWESNLQMSNK